MTHPMQDIILDDKGIPRFNQNKIVRFLLEKSGEGVNSLALIEFSNEDWTQFVQLIGYSVCGFGDLDYVPEDEVQKADLIAEELLALNSDV